MSIFIEMPQTIFITFYSLLDNIVAIIMRRSNVPTHGEDEK